MDHINTPIFQALFHSDVARIILEANPPHFTVMDYNNAHLSAIGNTAIEHRGEDFWNVYDKHIAGDINADELSDALNKAYEKNSVVTLAPFRLDALSDRSGEMLPRWWQLEVMPVEKQAGKVGYLMISTYNVTLKMLAEHREQLLNEELAATNEELCAALEDLQKTNDELAELNQNLEGLIEARVRALADSESSLRSLVMAAHYPLMILRGEDWVIEIANQPLVNLWDKTIEGVTGHRLLDILPEIKDQAFPGFLRQVYESGVGYGEEERIFHYNAPDGPATKYVSFYYDPLRNNDGEVCGIIVAADDITSKVLQRQQLEQSLTNEKAIAEKFTLLSAELAETVKALSLSNKELADYQVELHRKNLTLTESENRFRSLIPQAPVGICVIRASDLMVLEVNDGYLELVGKKRVELEGRTIWSAVAEAAEVYGPIMSQVIETGVAFVASEHQLVLVRYGIPETVFVDFVYEPVFDANEKVTAIMVVAIEVSEKVRARMAVEETEERSRLAIEAAEIGTFEFNYLTGLLVSSDRFDEIFELSSPMDREQVIAKYHPDDVHLSAEAHKIAKAEGKMMYEARLLDAAGAVRWIRVQAKVFYNVEGVPERLLGTVIDITEFKKLQQQKDDFLSIASHELKTPLTSLKGSLQLLSRMKNDPHPVMLPRLIDQADRSMEKISSLVEDLLNVTHMGHSVPSLQKTTFNVRQLLEDCCAHIREMGTHQLVFQGDSDLEVHADHGRIDQVLTNLVNNAVKYAPNSATIALIVERGADSAKIMVRDSGPGIPIDKQQQIFERYYRADDYGTQVSGLGLGLYISADIVRRHGGEIGVDSVFGQGATFWFTLPL